MPTRPRTYDKTIAAQLNLQPQQVAATIQLLDEGNTLPFIARYRKEMTGSLDELQLRQVTHELERLRKLDDRRDTVLDSIQGQGKLTAELEAQLNAAATLTELEDLYLPFKPKRRTRATIALENGLAPLAEYILRQADSRKNNDEAFARQFVNENVPTIEAAYDGAQDIIAEQISDHPSIRRTLREKALQFSSLRATKIDGAKDERGTFTHYYDFNIAVKHVKPHHTLALNRGESEKVLRVRVDVDERDWRRTIEPHYRVNRTSSLAPKLEAAIEDAAKRLLLPAIERDVRRTLTEAAELHAISVFADNLRGLLTQPPLKDQVVMGIDPGLKTGCKIAVVDATGKVLATEAVFPHEPQKQWETALRKLGALIEQHNVTLIAIGNGTASRETEQLAAELTRKLDGVKYLLVSEAGASVYSASELAREEMPDLDVTLRGAVSIARRVQDPLAELVKIDPRSIGVGMYQHDVDQKSLGDAATGVVESVVNAVGVELNTASPALLSYIAGIGPKLAANIVAHRDANGKFPNRLALKKVAGLGPKAFEQCAGFLRLRDSSDPLDASAIHPESYKVAKQVATLANIDFSAPTDARAVAITRLKLTHPLDKLATELNAGVPTLQDILEQLVRPGRDPREDLPTPMLRSDVLSMDDLREGMLLSGTVRNVVDFGAFVDIGVKQDGLLHSSQLPRGTRVSVGEIIEVKILSVDHTRGRIALGVKG